MSGVLIVGELLRGHAPLVAIVAELQIKAGSLPENCPLPALLVRTVSVIDQQMLKREAVVRSVERVSVTVRASSYREQRAIINLVRKAAAGFIGDKADCSRVSVTTAGTGPDVSGPGGTFEQAQDFRVSFDAAT